MEDNFIIFTVILPICLHLEEKIFHIPYKNEKSIEIINYNFFSNDYSSGSATNIEADSDTFSQYRFSKLIIKIPHFGNKVEDLNKIEKDYEKIFFKYYNRFIDSYRLITGRHKIRNVWNFSEFLPPLDITASKNINPEEFHSIEFVPGSDSQVLRKPSRSKKEHDDLEKSLLQEIPLTAQYLMDAKRSFQFFDLLHCNINAVIALEISVSSYIINKFAENKDIEKDAVEKFFSYIGIYGNIEAPLKLLTSKDLTLPNKKVLELCRKAIINRNRIVHRGLREINSNELTKQLEAIEEVIKFCNIN